MRNRDNSQKQFRLRCRADRVLAVAILAVAAGPAAGQEADEIAAIRAEIEQIRSEYEHRIAELERRLEAAEQAAESARRAQSTTPGGTIAAPQGGSVTAGNAFNPQISVILNGNYYHDGVAGAGESLAAEAAQPSHPMPSDAIDDHGHGASTQNGFNLRELELAFFAAVDPYFDAGAYLAFLPGGEVEIEEAWFATRKLPAGLRLKVGRFFSDIGYLNNKHPHQWDFVDQNLVYQNLLGPHGLQDTGVQLTWLPDLPLYTLVGVEITQGDQERIGALVDDENERAALGLSGLDSGPRLYSLFAKISPELGYDHALQVGASYVRATQHQEMHDEPLFETGLEGDAGLWGLDIVYKYDNPAQYGYRDLNVQAEYLHSTKNLFVRSGDPAAIGNARELATDGLYIQGLYGVAPRWQVGLRYDELGGQNEMTGDVDERFDSSNRLSGVLTWTPTEFSRLRVQYARSDIATTDGVKQHFNSIWVQWLMSMGAHGAHSF
jgi:hypothetical protein